MKPPRSRTRTGLVPTGRTQWFHEDHVPEVKNIECDGLALVLRNLIRAVVGAAEFNKHKGEFFDEDYVLSKNWHSVLDAVRGAEFVKCLETLGLKDAAEAFYQSNGLTLEYY